MNRENLRLYKLSLDTIIKPFKCSEQELNGFLFEDAKRFEDIEADVTAAYYSLLADKISFNPEEKRMWNRINRKIPNSKRRRTYPAVKIGRLAVDERYASCGLGTDIITQIKYALTETRRIGCRFLTVDALSSAIPFYEKNGFLFFSESDKDEETRLMFYDLKNFML